MTFNREYNLSCGKKVILRNGTDTDAERLLYAFNKAHEETDFLLTYPIENSFTPESEAAFLREKEESADEIEIVAVLDGKIIGSAGIESVGKKIKINHRAEFGVSIIKEWWGLGIGRLLTLACIECAKKAGYSQLELNVVADNTRAISLYGKLGFKEYGRNPRGFKSQLSGYQELVYMRLEL